VLTCDEFLDLLLHIVQDDVITDRKDYLHLIHVPDIVFDIGFDPEGVAAGGNGIRASGFEET